MYTNGTDMKVTTSFHFPSSIINFSFRQSWTKYIGIGMKHFLPIPLFTLLVLLYLSQRNVEDQHCIGERGNLLLLPNILSMIVGLSLHIRLRLCLRYLFRNLISFIPCNFYKSSILSYFLHLLQEFLKGSN